MVKNEYGLIDHGTLKSGVSHKWFDELSILIQWFLYADSDGIIFGLMTSPINFVSLTSKCWRTTAVALSQSFWEKFPLGKNDPKIGFFLYFEKFYQNWDLLKTYLNKNCSKINLMDRDFGFMTRFWISTTELFLIMNSFAITERNKIQCIYQWICDIQIIWNLSYMNLLGIFVWTLNYVDCIFFYF